MKKIILLLCLTGSLASFAQTFDVESIVTIQNDRRVHALKQINSGLVFNYARVICGDANGRIILTESYFDIWRETDEKSKLGLKEVYEFESFEACDKTLMGLRKHNSKIDLIINNETGRAYPAE